MPGELENIGSQSAAALMLSQAAQSYTRHSCRVAEVECLVETVGGVQIISPRGTELRAFISGHGWRDVLRDLRLIPWYDKRVGWAHSGFLKGAQGLIDKGLYKLLTREKPIAISGHSLGGAIGLCVAAILYAEGFNVIGVINFGAPRCFLRGTVNRFKKTKIPVYEYSNPGDPVPNMPFRFWGFKHVNEVSTGLKRSRLGFKNHSLSKYCAAFIEQ
jgi:hypothetical protein